MNCSDFSDEQLVNELARTFNDVFGASLLKVEILRRINSSEADTKELLQEVINLRAEIGQAEASASMHANEAAELRQRLAEFVQAKQAAINSSLEAEEWEKQYDAIGERNLGLEATDEIKSRKIQRLQREIQALEEDVERLEQDSERRAKTLLQLWRFFRSGERFCGCETCAELQRKCETEKKMFIDEGGQDDED